MKVSKTCSYSILYQLKISRLVITRKCLILTFFLNFRESKMAVFTWLLIMAQYNRFHFHLTQQVGTELCSQSIVSSVGGMSTSC